MCRDERILMREGEIFSRENSSELRRKGWEKFCSRVFFIFV